MPRDAVAGVAMLPSAATVVTRVPPASPQLTLPPSPAIATAWANAALLFEGSVSTGPNLPPSRMVAKTGPGVLPAETSDVHRPPTQPATPRPLPESESVAL